MTYDILLTRGAHRFYKDADIVLVRKLNRCFQRLRDDPYEHANIKQLKGPLAGRFRYRAGDWRVVYQINEEEHPVIVLLIAHRSEAYR